MTSLPARRRAAATTAVTTAAAVVLALSLSACGGSDGAAPSGGDIPTSTETSTGTSTESSAADARVYTSDQLTSALITTDDLPDGFTVDTSGDDDSPTNTCLDDISNLDKLDGFQADDKAKAEFKLATADGNGANQVSSTLDSYADADATNAALDLFLGAAQKCTSAQGTDADGFTYDLTLDTTEGVTLPGVDRQITTTIDGTLTTQGQAVPVTFDFIVASVGNNLMAFSTSDIGTADSLTSQAESLASTQLQKLAALG